MLGFLASKSVCYVEKDLRNVFHLIITFLKFIYIENKNEVNVTNKYIPALSTILSYLKHLELYG